MMERFNVTMGDFGCYRGGVPAMAGAVEAVLFLRGFVMEGGTDGLTSLFRFAINCIFFRNAMSRVRMLMTTCSDVSI